ncbi:leptin receptor gene-related protein-like isoform X2 [Homalodisca vitripennis]|uniref:leptin receptor gene-related protein-like isoform X2 n=1 Tax=Homalodisca vitripennis TaxID=197043 RepID=UPI001EE9E891|nr:leptin receptor gene-related protein-like isoform X2 [Homalodisca vitripennis]
MRTSTPNPQCRNWRLVTLAFTGSIGMTLVILACALPAEKVWWPFFVVVFYVLAPMPTILARRYTEHTGSSNSSIELAIFLTMGFVVSSFALPIVLARAPAVVPVIQWSACYLTLAGNIIVYLTYIGFFVTLYQEDSDYSMW